MVQEFSIDTEDILSDFLRVRLTDPEDRAEDSETNSFTATSGQTVFSLTATTGSVSCVTAVTVNGTSKTKWKDYFWDYQNSKITFYDGLTLSDAVVVTFKQGTTNWIYSDQPNEKITSASFPRISLFTVGGGGTRQGNYNAPYESNPMIQIDIWARKDKISTISSKKYSNEYLARYLGNQIKRAFEEYESDLFPVLYNYNLISGPRTAPYSMEYQSYHSILEITIAGLDMGRIVIT